MNPADFAQAAAALAAGAALARVPGLAQPLGPGHLRLARLAALCDRLFLARPPLAPGAVMCGASHSPRPMLRAHAAGIGPDALAAWTRAMGEVAEARALHDDPCGTVPLLDHALRPCGSINAAQVRRLAGDTAPAHGLGAGADVPQAARAAWREAVERHAIALWLEGSATARPLDPGPAVRALAAALRAGVAAPPLRFLRLPGAMPGLVVVVALSDRPEGVVPGFGCAPDVTEAACKAATEVVQGEFALHLGQLVPRTTDNAAIRARNLADRPDLTQPTPGPLELGEPVAPHFAVLTRPDDAVPVMRVVADGLRTPAPGAI